MATAGKRKETLAEGLNKSADARGLRGKARERYIIGGAIHTYDKSRPRPKRERAKKATAPAPHRKIELVARKNAAASAARSYDVYSVYEKDKKTPYSQATYRSLTAAKQAAKTAQEQNNHPKGVHSQNKFI